MRKIRIGLEITHACDKYCPRCSHRVATSTYKHMTMEQYNIVAQAMVGLDVCEVSLVGGEPLMHPQFSQLLWRVHDDFPRANLFLATNGSHLNVLSRNERDLFKLISLSFYGEFNQDIVRKIIEEPLQYPNVFINDRRNFDDPDIDPHLDEEKAMRCSILCHQRCVRIIGTRVYGCCLAEAVERHYGTEKVHMELRPSWYEVFESLPTYKACQRCHVAAQLMQCYTFRYKEHILKFLKSSLVTRPVVTVYQSVRRSMVRRQVRHCVCDANGAQSRYSVM